jgi:hypothetical protein
MTTPAMEKATKRILLTPTTFDDLISSSASGLNGGAEKASPAAELLVLLFDFLGGIGHGYVPLGVVG